MVKQRWIPWVAFSLMIMALPTPATAYTPTSERSAKASAVAAKGKGSPSVRVSIKGLPKRVKARVTVRGPRKYKKTVAKSTTLKKLRPGTYRIKAGSVRVGPVRATATVRPRKVRVKAGTHSTVRVTYRKAATPVTPPSTAVPLRFNLAQAVGIALPATSGASSAKVQAQSTGETNLLAVAADGSTAPAITSGEANINHAVVGPDNNVYVEYGVTNGRFPEGCWIARIDRATGVPACLAPAVQPDGGSFPNIAWPPDAFQQNPPMQFDALGRVYYSGLTQDPRNMGWYLKRNDNGQVTDMINASINPGAWLVLPNGSILMRGSTQGTQQQWFRRILPNGAIETPLLGQDTRTEGLIALFPDNNAYVGAVNYSNSNLNGVMQFNTGSGTFAPAYWIAKPTNGQPATTFDITSECTSPAPNANSAFCSSTGTNARSFVTTQDQRTLAIVGTDVVQYYPQPNVLDLPVTPTIIEAAGSQLAVTGTDLNGRNVTGIVDPATAQFTTLLSPTSEIEVYHLRQVPDSNSLMFDGLRFADGRYVIGRIDLGTGATQLTPAEKLSDFQVF